MANKKQIETANTRCRPPKANIIHRICKSIWCQYVKEIDLMNARIDPCPIIAVTAWQSIKSKQKEQLWFMHIRSFWRWWFALRSFEGFFSIKKKVASVIKIVKTKIKTAKKIWNSKVMDNSKVMHFSYQLMGLWPELALLFLIMWVRVDLWRSAWIMWIFWNYMSHY